MWYNMISEIVVCELGNYYDIKNGLMVIRFSSGGCGDSSSPPPPFSLWGFFLFAEQPQGLTST